MFQRVISSLGVVIPTVGRKDIVEGTIDSLAHRKTLPSCVVVVGATQNDLPNPDKEMPFKLQFLVAQDKGSTVQRNYGVRHLPRSIEYVSFLDDDIEVHDEYFAEAENVFRVVPEVAGFSGSVLVNGGIDRQAARSILDQHQIAPELPAFAFYPKRWPGFYGCAMNIRRCLLDKEQFDERLPLYGLGDDCEMGFRLSRHGYVGGSGRCPVVHLATKSGRVSEVGIGYSQIINHLYFARKGIGYPKIKAYRESLVKMPLINLFFLLFSFLEHRKNIDRKGRFRGNLLAIIDVAHGRIDPMNLLRIVGDQK